MVCTGKETLTPTSPFLLSTLAVGTEAISPKNLGFQYVPSGNSHGTNYKWMHNMKIYKQPSQTKSGLVT